MDRRPHGGWDAAPGVARIFRLKPDKDAAGASLRLHRHQLDAIRAARAGRHYVLTTGTGPGKSLVSMVPIVDAVLRGDRRPGIKAIVVYPMNALANSQKNELEKFLTYGYPDGQSRVTFRRYTRHNGVLHHTGNAPRHCGFEPSRSSRQTCSAALVRSLCSGATCAWKVTCNRGRAEGDWLPREGQTASAAPAPSRVAANPALGA